MKGLRQMKVLQCLFSLVVIGLLAACTLGKDNALPPSPLVKFTQTLQARLLWSQSTGNGAGGYYLRFIPAGDQGMVFTASRDGLVSAINAKTGQVVWRVQLRHQISSGVAAGGGGVYVGTDGAELIALSEKNGHVLWQHNTDSEALAPALYAGGRVIVHTISGSLSAISAKTGARLWRFDQSVPSLILHAAGQPQVAGGNVIAGFSNGELSVLNLYTGKLKWEQHVAMPAGDNPVTQMVDITVNPVVVDGVVYAATYQGQIAAYSLDNGQLIWQHQISSYAGIAANQTQVFVADATSNVWAFDENSGGVNWKQTNLQGRQITGPVIYHNALVVADRYGYLHFMSLRDGHFLARMSIGQGAISQPVVYRDVLYVYTSNGNLLAIHTK